MLTFLGSSAKLDRPGLFCTNKSCNSFNPPSVQTFLLIVNCFNSQTNVDEICNINSSFVCLSKMPRDSILWLVIANYNTMENLRLVLPILSLNLNFSYKLDEK